MITSSSIIRAQNQDANSELIAGIQSGGKFFTENKGQIASLENNSPVPSVLFYSSGKSSNVYLRNDGISYVFYKIFLPEIDPNDPYSSYKTTFNGEWERIDMQLIDCNSNPEIETSETLDYYENFYLAHCPDGITKVRSNKKITYKNIYPNIDWVIYYTENNELKYDFTVHPGGNPDDIKIKYNWANAPILNTDGSVLINGPLGNITEKAPFVTQGINEINSAWFINQNGTLKIKTDSYDLSKDLTIDPIIIWATYYGGSANDFGYSIKSDGTSLFVSGAMASNNFPTQDPGSGAYFQGTYTGGAGNDAFVMRFNTLGIREWATYYGGTGDDGRETIAINTNSIYLTGQTSSNDFPTLNPGGGAYYQPTNSFATASEAFVVRFDKSGSRIWSTYLGGSFWDAGYSIFCNDNFVYVAITSGSTDMPIFNPGGGAYIQNVMAGINDDYIIQFNTSGVPIWGTYVGGTDDEEAFPCIGEFNGSIYLVGGTKSTNFPLLNPGGTAFFQPTNAGGKDVTISRFSTGGVLNWSTYIGGTGDEAVRTIWGINNNVWIGGFSSSTNIPLVNPNNGAFYQSVNAGGFDAFIASFNNSNEYTWGTIYGGNGNDWVSALHSDNNSLWVSGKTFSTNLPVLNPLMGSFFQGTRGGGQDAFILKFKQNGIRQWATYYGGILNEDGTYIYSDNTNVWVAGYSNSTSIVTVDHGSGAYWQPVNNGGAEALILKFDVCIKPDVTINNVTPVICFGDTATLVAGGALTYQWLLPSVLNDTLSLIPPLTANYIVTGTDDMNCINTANATVTVNPLPIVNITGAHPICFLDTITIFANGANTYQWLPLLTTDTFLTITPPVTADYIVIGTDTNNCKNIDTTTVIVYPLPNVTITGTHPICFGDTLSLFGNGALTYVWYPGLVADTAITVHPDSTSMYIVLGTDTNGCKFIDTTTVIVNPLPSIYISGNHDLCFGDSLTLHVTSDLPAYYLWTPVNSIDSILLIHPDTASHLFTYSVLVTDTINGCKSSISTSIYVNPLPQLQISPPDSTCYGTPFALLVTSDLPSSYQWSPGLGTDSLYIVNPDTVGNTFNYSVIVTDTIHGCKDTASTSIFVNGKPDIFITGAGSFCPDTTINIQVHDIYHLPLTYDWHPANVPDSIITFVLNTPNMTYFDTVYVETPQGCKDTATTTITTWPIPNVNITPNDTAICFGQPVNINITSNMPSNLFWTIPDTIQNAGAILYPDSVGYTYNYIAHAIDSIHGCKNKDSVSVFVNDKPVLNLNGLNLICPYETITLTGSSSIPVSYLWTPTNSTDSFIVFHPGTSDTTYAFTLYGTTSNNCKDTASTFVVVYPSINVSITPTDTAICLLDSITLNAHGGNTYEWLIGSGTVATTPNLIISPNGNTTYTLIGTSTEFCKDTASVDITVYSLPKFNVIGIDTICKGNSTVFSVDSAFNNSNTYVWMPGNLTGNSVTLSPQDTTRYFVTGTDTNTCHFTVSFEIIVDTLPIAQITGITPICYGATIDLQASGGSSFLWQPGNDTNPTHTVTPDSAGTFIYTLIANSTICYDTTVFQLTVYPKPVLTLTHDTTLIIGQDVPLHVTGADLYDWSPINDLSCIDCPNPVARPFSTIEYCVIGSNAYECSDTACINITVDTECGEVFVPSGFSPNGDGQNDIFYVYGKCIKSMEFRVFNRWGEKVFETTDPSIGWDGIYRGKEADTDVFVYYLKAEYFIGSKVETKGNITLMR